jgi:hypothetical protein
VGRSSGRSASSRFVRLRLGGPGVLLLFDFILERRTSRPFRREGQPRLILLPTAVQPSVCLTRLGLD